MPVRPCQWNSPPPSLNHSQQIHAIRDKLSLSSPLCRLSRSVCAPSPPGKPVAMDHVFLGCACIRCLVRHGIYKIFAAPAKALRQPSAASLSSPNGHRLKSAEPSFPWPRLHVPDDAFKPASAACIIPTYFLRSSGVNMSIPISGSVNHSILPSLLDLPNVIPSP